MQLPCRFACAPRSCHAQTLQRQEASVAHASSFIKIEESKLTEEILAEEHIEESHVRPEYIIENLIYEDGLYEYRLSENIISQAYIIEATVGVTTVEQILGQLPASLDEYDIDWPSVIAKFAVGTTIIIAVGVINYASHGSTYFVFGSPARIAKDALIGGAIGAALNTMLQCLSNGETVDAAILKYSIEGFADGYMWGAITSVLRIANENYKRLRAFNAATGGTDSDWSYGNQRKEFTVEKPCYVRIGSSIVADWHWGWRYGEGSAITITYRFTGAENCQIEVSDGFVTNIPSEDPNVLIFTRVLTAKSKHEEDVVVFRYEPIQVGSISLEVIYDNQIKSQFDERNTVYFIENDW